MDLAAAPGTVVLAAGAGVVGYAGVLAGRGVVTVLHAGGLRTTYQPLHPLVRSGQQVSLGTVLGTLEPGHPGCTRSACLHWGLIDQSVYLDPLSLLRHGPVRLLPLADAPPGDAGPASRQGAAALPEPGPSGLPGPGRPDSGRPDSGRLGGGAAGGSSAPATPPRAAAGWPGTGSAGRSDGVPWTDPGTVAALGLAVAGGLVLIRRRPP